MDDREQEIPGTSVKVVRVGSNDPSSRTGRTGATKKPSRYGTMEEKVRDIERYLIWQVDLIRKWVVVAVGISTLCAVAAVASLWISLRNTDGARGAEVTHVAAEPEISMAAPPLATEKSGLAVTPESVPPVPEAAQATADPSEEVAAEAAEEAAAKVREQAAAEAADKAAAKAREQAAAEASDRAAAKAREQAAAEASDRAAAKAREQAAAEAADRAAAKARKQAAAEAADRAAAKVREEAAAEAADKAATKLTKEQRDAAPPVTVTREQVLAESPTGGSQWSFRVGASAIATRVVRLDPVGTGDRFSPGRGRLYCWTRIETDSFSRIPRNSRFVIHRWIHEGTVVRERKITIGSARYRVYSMVPNPGGRPGQWRVEILDAEGRVIGTREFVVE